MTQEQTIHFINKLVKIRIAPSPIQGVGVFAMRDIPKNTRLEAGMFPQKFHIPYGSIKKLFPEVRQLLLERWPQIVNGSPFLWPEAYVQAYMNHSSEDANYDAIKDITLRDIKAGEEILEDYRVIPGFEKVHKWLIKN